MIEEIIRYALYCDKCGKEYLSFSGYCRGKNKDEITNAALSDNWNIVDGKFLCDICSKSYTKNMIDEIKKNKKIL